jgi:hypothetical protein
MCRRSPPSSALAGRRSTAGSARASSSSDWCSCSRPSRCSSRRAQARGRGAAALLDTFDRLNRSLAAAPALRRFVEVERDAALRIITSGAGIVQPRIVDLIAEVIEDEARAARYEPPVETATLAYAIVKLAEAFVFSDAVAGVRGDVDRLREFEAALLGV